MFLDVHFTSCQYWSDFGDKGTTKISTGHCPHQLYFNEHVSGYYLKAVRKLNALSQISRHSNLKSKSFIYNNFLVSNYNWCPLVWYFSDTANSNKFENYENSPYWLQIAH